MANREFTNINGINVCDQTARDSIPTKTSQLTNDANYVTETFVTNKIAEAQLGGDISQITQLEPEELDMPKVFFYGNALPTTKDNVNLTMDYISNTAKFSSFVKLKCQGTSSMSYAKKNFTVSMFSDEARTTKLKKDFKGWGAQSKFCLKANYVDTTHTRNISGARIAYDMVQSRPDSPFKQQLLQCPRNGAVDGFPIKLYFNGEFYGIYTWNVPKDAWMFNMKEDNPNHCVLCAEQNNNGNMNTINSCQFRKVWNGSGDWSVEVGTASANIKASFDRCINFVMTATDEEFKTNIGNYFDLYSLLDYYCFSYLVAHIDGLAKNMLMATYDGVIWGACLYDMDSIYGVDWNGSSFKATNIQCPEQYQETNSLLWQRIKSCFSAELYARYLELRQDALSLSNIIKHVEEIYDVIPDRVLADEKAKWTSLPAINDNTMTRFRNYMRDRAVYVDAQMEEIGTKVPCTGIVLGADTLSFTTTDTQTLEVVVSPSNTTDTIAWSVEPAGIVTVDNGVVTPLTNGTCTITATCGSYSDTCSVTVSLPSVECTGITLDKNTLQLGTIQGTAPDSTTNLLEGVTWKDGTVNDNGTIREGTDKYVEVTITVPGVYKLSQTGKYVYLKVIDAPTVVGHPYMITHPNGSDIVFNVFDTPRTFLMSVYLDNQIWNPSLVTLNYMSSIKESCTLFDDEQQITDANLINIRWTDTDYNYIELNLNSLISQNKVVVKFNNVNYRITSGNVESLNSSQRITDLASDNFTQFNEWNRKTLFYFRLPIAWGSTKEEIMNYMIANQINKLVINPSDYINSLPTAGVTTKLSQQLTATVTPDNCTQPVVWSVDPTGIVRVNEGLVTAVANGEATVTATCGTQTATCAVTVSGMSESGGDTGDYTDIGYIESTGTQYINTRIVPTASTKIELVAEMSASKQYDHIFGSDNFMKAQWTDNTGTVIEAVKKNGQNSVSGLTLGKHTYVMDMTDTANVITIDGATYGTNIGHVESTTNPLLLLCGYKADRTIETGFCGVGKIYSCKIYYEDTLVANMKPVLTNSGTYGLLDTVNNTFYGSEVGSFTGGGTPSGGDTPSTNANLVFQVDSASMNTTDNTLTDNIAGISATLTGNPTVSDNQIAFTASDTFTFDISSLNLTSSNRTFRIKFTPTSLDNTLRNVIGIGNSNNVWDNITSSYIASEKLILQHGLNGLGNVTVGSPTRDHNGNRLSVAPVTGQEYELVISENTNGNIRWFIDGVLVQDGTTALFNPLYLSNTEGINRFIGSYSLIEIYNGYCNDYTEFTNMVNNASSGGDSGVNYLANASWQDGTINVNNTGMSTSTDDRYTTVQIPAGKYVLTSSNATYKKFRLSDSKGNVLYHFAGENSAYDIIIDTTISDDTIFTLEVSYYKPNDTIEVPSLTTTDRTNITTLTLDGSLSYGIPNWPNNPSGQNGQVNVEYALSGITKLPMGCKFEDYTFNSNLSEISAIGLAKQYRISLYNGTVYLAFTLDMAETGVTNDVESITNYLSNNPLTFKYVM